MKKVTAKYSKHGCATGGKLAPEYNSWASMKKRCLNENCSAYPWYGGRGISICERWIRSFKDFLSDMGPRPSPDHSIDRIDPNKDYCPENCRWATKTEQANNKNPAKNRTFFNGESVIAASKRLGGCPSLVSTRINNGWSIDRAFSESPTRKYLRKTPRSKNEIKIF